MSALALGAGLAPGAAQALDTFDAPSMDLGSSVSVAATVEALMLGIVLGTVPITAPWVRRMKAVLHGLRYQKY